MLHDLNAFTINVDFLKAFSKDEIEINSTSILKYESFHYLFQNNSLSFGVFITNNFTKEDLVVSILVFINCFILIMICFHKGKNKLNV